MSRRYLAGTQIKMTEHMRIMHMLRLFVMDSDLSVIVDQGSFMSDFYNRSGWICQVIGELSIILSFCVSS